MSGRLNVDGRVSVVMATHNSEDAFIPQALGSLINQTYEDLEIIVVDGKSTDNTVGLCEDILRGSGKPWAIYHTNGPEAETPVGLKWPHLVGAGNSTGEYLIFQADDDFSDSRRVELLVDAIGNAPMAYSTMIKVNVNGEVIGREGSDINDALYDAVVNHTEDAWAPHICMQQSMCRKELFFSERAYLLGKSFWEVIHTIRMYGIGDLVWAPDSLFYYRHWPGQNTMMGAATDDVRAKMGYTSEEMHMGRYNYALDSTLRNKQVTHDWDEVLRLTNVEAKRIARQRFDNTN